MDRTEADNRADALEAALEWLFYYIVKQSKDSDELVEDFERHMKSKEESMEDEANKSLLMGDMDACSSARDVKVAMETLRCVLVFAANR